MAKTTKPAVKKTVKTETKTTTKKPVAKKAEVKVSPETGEVKVEKVNKALRAKMTNLETAYLAAISGKIKFSKVKEMFKKLHKEVKKTATK